MSRRALPVLACGVLAAPAAARAQPTPAAEAFSRGVSPASPPPCRGEMERGSFHGAGALVACDGEVVHHEACRHQDQARHARMLFPNLAYGALVA